MIGALDRCSQSDAMKSIGWEFQIDNWGTVVPMFGIAELKIL